MADVYLSEAEFAARYLNGARRTAQRWRVTGDGPPFVRLGPRRVAYRERDCEAWAQARTFRSRADEFARQDADTRAAAKSIKAHPQILRDQEPAV